MPGTSAPHCGRSLWLTSLLFLPLLALLVACDQVPDDADRAYVRGFCTATTAFSDRLAAETTSEGIATATGDYQQAVRALQPPADVAAFQARFLSYLDEALNSPGQRVGHDPPTPSGDARRRLDNAAGTEDACDGQRFFASR
jgi:hypothetical protein